jgi:hypothetical protein
MQAVVQEAGAGIFQSGIMGNWPFSQRGKIESLSRRLWHNLSKTIVCVLVACAPLPELQPPNTRPVCERFASCGAIPVASVDSCVTCIEGMQPERIYGISKRFENLPPEFSDIECSTVAEIAAYLELQECVEGE